jgi:hypothetical protein
LRHQQECQEDQGVHNRDRDHTNGKTAVMVIKVRPKYIVKSRCDKKRLPDISVVPCTRVDAQSPSIEIPPKLLALADGVIE